MRVWSSKMASFAFSLAMSSEPSNIYNILQHNNCGLIRPQLLCCNSVFIDTENPK